MKLQNELQDLLRDYVAMRALRDRTEASLPKYDSIERQLTVMRRKATKIINQLNPGDVGWKLAFGLLS